MDNLDKAFISISKDKLATLPAANYSGEIHLIDKPEDVESAVAKLRAADIIGFDTETRPSFKKGQKYNVALIQLATEKDCFLFRINKIGFPESLKEILEDESKLKIGLSLHDDFHHLKESCEFEPASFIDLQGFVKEYKIADNSLSRLYGILFNERISKSQRLTNWEAPTLTEAQKIYASLDADACIRIYKYLKDGNFDFTKSEYLTYPPDPEITEEE